MIKEITTTQLILKADKGKQLYNGTTYGTTIVLPLNTDASNWSEITEEALPKEEGPIV